MTCNVNNIRYYCCKSRVHFPITLRLFRNVTHNIVEFVWLYEIRKLFAKKHRLMNRLHRFLVHMINLSMNNLSSFLFLLLIKMRSKFPITFDQRLNISRNIFS